MTARRWHGPVVGAFLASLVVLNVVGAGPATARGPSLRPVLGEVNIISGDRIAGMNVRIPETVDIPEEHFDNSAISIHGAGRVVGFALVEDRRPISKAYQLVATRWDFCGKPGCTGEWQTSLTTGMNWRGRHGFRIPAGDYRLYIVADTAPARIELRLDGLKGQVDLRPEGDITGRIATPTSTVATPSPYTFFGRGRPMIMPVHGLLIDGDANEFGPGVSANGSCYWRAQEGEEDLQHSTPGPHCLEFAERGGAGSSFATLGEGGFRSWGTGTVPPGEWRSSHWATTASASANPQFLALWLSYEDPAQP